MEGLIKANLSIYFDTIKRGVDHSSAIFMVLKTRYPLSSSKRREVESFWRGARKAELQSEKNQPPTRKDLEMAELKDLIHSMYSVETHLDRTDVFKRIKENEKFDSEFNKLYDSLKIKYSK